MLGRSKPVVFDPYGHRRSRPRVPRWLLLLILGAALGAGGVLLVQERYLPPRLSAQASAELRQSYEQADAERTRLKSQLADTTRQLQGALADKKSLTAQVTAGRETAERLRQDVTALVDALPPDPRGGAVEVRAARFTVEGGQLAYDVVLSRTGSGGKLSGVMQLVVTGDSARRTEETVTPAPISISLSKYDSVRGSVAIPEGFKPRQTTIQVLDRPNGKRLGMRVIHVR